MRTSIMTYCSGPLTVELIGRLASSYKSGMVRCRIVEERTGFVSGSVRDFSTTALVDVSILKTLELPEVE